MFSTALYDSLMGNSANDISNDPFQSVDNMRTRYADAGAQAPAPVHSNSLAETAINVLNYPGNVVRSAVFGSGLDDLSSALLGQKTFRTDEFLKNQGAPDNFGRHALGFIGDVLLDPLAYVGSGLFKNAGKAALDSSVATRIADSTIGSVAEKTSAMTGHGLDRVNEALSTFGSGIKPDMNSITASKAMLDGTDLTQEALKLGANRFKTQEVPAVAELTKANQSLSGMLGGPVTSNLAGKTTPALRSELANGISSGAFTESNAWRISEPRNYVEVQARIQALIGKDLSPDSVVKLINLHMSGSPQVHTLLNLAENYGTKITDFGTAFDMAKKFENVDFVNKITQANARLLGAQSAFDTTHIRAVYANNLVADIDKLGNKRYWGIMTPTGKAILPLIDVSPISNALSKVGDTAYAHSSILRAFSDWGSTAFGGGIMRNVYMDAKASPEGAKTLEQMLQGKAIIRDFNQTKQVLPQFAAEFARTALGDEIIHADPLVAAQHAYMVEANKLVEVTRGSSVTTMKDPYTRYIWGNIANDPSITEGELRFARDYIMENAGEDGLKHVHDIAIDPFIAKRGDLGKLTPEEIATLKGHAEQASFSTDAMYAADTVLGADMTNGYASEYVYHMYRRDNPNDLLVGPQSARAAGLADTNTGLRASNERKFNTIGEAIANDLTITAPLTSTMDITTARFMASLSFGMNTGLVRGIDNLFASKLQTELAKLAQEKGIAYSTTERVAGKDVVTDVSPELMKKNRDLMQAGQSTMDVLVQALGGKEGLKALTEVIRPGKVLTQAEKSSGQWVPIDNVYKLTQSGGSGGVYYARRELIPHIEALNKPIASTMAMRQMLEFTDKATRIIKLLQTTLNPPFALRNIAGEGMMSFGNGTTLRDLEDAGKMLKAMGKTTEMDGKTLYAQEALARLKVMRGTDSTVINGTRMTADEAATVLNKEHLVDLGATGSKSIFDVYGGAVRNGLINTGHNSDVNTTVSRVSQAVSATTWQERAAKELASGNPVAGVGKAYKSVMESVTGNVDSVFRLADHIHNMREGMTEANSFLRVKQFHVDYNDLTQFERGVMRRIAPYYTFMRRNVPIQLRLMVERPAYYGTVGKMLNSSYAALGDPSTPDYLKKNMAIPIYKDEYGNVTYLNWNLPMADLSKFRLDPRDTGKELMQNLHPFIKAPFDLAAGKNIGFGTPIKPADYLFNQLGGVSTAGKAAAQLATPDENFQGKYAAPRYALPLFQSLVPKINPAKEDLSRAYTYRAQLLADMSARKKGGQPIPELTPYASKGISDHANDANPTKYNPKTGQLTPINLSVYDRNPNYYPNKDWVRTHSNQFTP